MAWQNWVCGDYSLDKVPNPGTQLPESDFFAMQDMKTHSGASKLLSRLNDLLRILQSKERCTSREMLVRKLQTKKHPVSVRSVSRDLEHLRERGYQIKHSKSRGYHLETPKEWLHAVLDRHEEVLPSIILMRALLQSVNQFEPGSGADVLIKQIHQLLEKQGLKLDNLENYVSSTAMPMPERQVPVFRALVKGLFEQRQVKVSYKGNKDRVPRERIIHPHHLLECEGRWYCIAYCCDSKTTRTFVPWRMFAAEMTEEAFVRPAALDDPKTWERQSEVFGVWSNDQEPVQVRLKMRGYAARLIEEAGYRPKAMKARRPSAEPDSVIVTFNVHSFEDVIPWILKWGAYCQVLSPPELVDKVHDQLGAMLDLYQQSQTPT